MDSAPEITKVRIVIRHLLWQIRYVRNDSDAAWKWVNRFANTLQYQELEQDPDQYALAILAEARSFNDQQRRKGQMLGVRKQLAKEGVSNPTQEQLDEKWLEMYGHDNSTHDATNGNAVDDRKVATSCDTLKAYGDTREGSQAKPYGSAITRNETRAFDALDSYANHYGPRKAKNGDAATREGADVSTTVSMNMRRVPQNGAPAHGFSGWRTAQGTMSRSPEAAAQSGKDSAKNRDTRDESRGRYAQPSCSPEDGNHYDQDASTSTDDPQPEGLTGPNAGGSCVEISDAATTSCASTISTNPSQEAPTRKAGDELTESGNGSLRNPPPSCEEHLDKTRQRQRTGAAPERVKNQPSSHCGKAPVRSFGESGLVHMTDAQANSLRSYYGEDFDRAVGILENYILSLPSKAEGDEKGESKFWREDYAKRNHYFAMRRDNWVDNALKKSKTADKRLENASNPNYKSFKQQDIDARTEFFSKSIFDGKEAI